MFVEPVITSAAPRLSAHPHPSPSMAEGEAVSNHAALSECHRMHRQLEAIAPEWFDGLAQHDLLLCEDSELDALLGSAPGDFMAGYVFSWFSSRNSIVMMTQRYAPSGFQGPARRAGIEQLKRESEAHDAWFAQLDLLDVDTCDKHDLLDLLICAPSPFMRGYLYGKITMRVEIAAMTGRAF
jgi:hypothetical protein